MNNIRKTQNTRKSRTLDIQIFRKSDDQSFLSVLKKRDIAIIGEIKFASPSEGKLGSQKNFLKRIKEYEASSIDAISIVTEKKGFKGNSKFVSKAKKHTHLPVLMKEFVVSEVQIYNAKKVGADAVLLIARMVSGEVLKRFVDLCLREGIEPIVEVFDLLDLKKAVNTQTRIIAVNARDLETFKVDVHKASRLLKKIPNSYIKLGFSGVKSKKEIEIYRKAGAAGVLVGTSLMKAKNIQDFISSLRGVKVKICGVRTLRAAEVAVANGADFLGFNFIPKSSRYVDPLKAKKIINDLRISQNVLRTKMVGVFQNQPSDVVNKVAKLLSLDFVQLHGDEDGKYIGRMNTPIIKLIKKKDTNYAKQNTKYYILDREVQGQGKMVDVNYATEFAKHYPTILAGGLTPENVSEAVKKVKPFMVDVASGVETNGVQDLKKIKEFIKKTKGANL